MKKGVVERFNPQRGYGYIAGADGDNIFVHSSGLIDKGAHPPVAGDQVTYDVAPTSRGPKAVNVRTLHSADGASSVSGGDEHC